MQKNQFSVNYTNTIFLKTSQTAAKANRLNWRAEVLLNQNRATIKGKRVLDLASHDGRFSYACLELGASYVEGIEARDELVHSARNNLAGLGYGDDKVRFIKSDLFDYLPLVQTGAFDVILCFGFFYHTIRQIELIHQIARIKPKYFILDTAVIPEKKINTKSFCFRLKSRIKRLIPNYILNSNNSLLRYRTKANFEHTQRGALVFKSESCKSEASTSDPIELVAWPNKSFIESQFEAKGIKFQELFWHRQKINNWVHLYEYRSGTRVSYIMQLY